MSLPFAGVNRNKRSLVVDPRTPAGKEIILRLARDADVLVHNFRPSVMKKLGLDYASLEKINPRLVYASSSGWGDEGPYVARDRKGHADMAAATGGRFRFDENGVPTPPGISMDIPAGLLLCNGILIALLERARTGRGQQITTDLLSAAVMTGVWDAPEFLNPSTGARRDDDLRLTEAALPKVWQTRDGYFEISAVFSPDALRDISMAIGLGDLTQDPRFATTPKRLENKAALAEIMAQRFREKTTAEWLAILEPRDVLCAEINRFEQAVHDPQLQANQMVAEMDRPGVGNIKVLGTPIRLSRTPSTGRLPAPFLGEHTEAVLRELGYVPAEIETFRTQGVIP
jgi:crotonobetainyl-CoA:carnitine CoA-transferase CaiB-like acyl-CoA transferase